MSRVIQDLEESLRQHAGLDPSALPREVVAHALRERMRARQATTESAYLHLVETDPDERAALIDAVVVPETWFFRDGAPFEYLKKYVTHEWLPWHPGSRLRLLSLPCSTGEEPYSMAMSLMDICLEPGFFLVDAVDISASAIEKARQGVFGKNSFRTEGSFQQRYFTAEGKNFRIEEEVRSSVRFIRSHALAFAAAAPAGAYDIIFCRNLLIYFMEDMRRDLLENLRRMLMPGGLIFLGHAETPCVFLPDFEPIRHTGAFAARKPDALQAVALSKIGKTTGRPAVAPCRPALPVTAAMAAPLASGTQAPGLSVEAALAEARRCADSGDYAGACALCAAVLTRDRGCAEAYHVAGLAALAQGKDEEAIRCFERTLYLDPAHQPAMVHLDLLMEKTGHHDAARRYRRRAERAHASNLKVTA